MRLGVVAEARRQFYRAEAIKNPFPPAEELIHALLTIYYLYKADVKIASAPPYRKRVGVYGGWGEVAMFSGTFIHVLCPCLSA